VLECLGLSIACGRAGDDGDVMIARLASDDVMVTRLVSSALRLLPGQVACMASSCCFRVTWRFAPPHASVASLESCVQAHALVRAGLVVRGGDLSCEGSSSGKLVGDAAVWPRTRRHASEGLDEDLHTFPRM
jgi:hypothetical protein